MKELILAAVTCYQGGSGITMCDNGTTAYQLGNQTVVTTPDRPPKTIYRLGNQYQINSNSTPEAITPVQSIQRTEESFGVLKPFD